MHFNWKLFTAIYVFLCDGMPSFLTCDIITIAYTYIFRIIRISIQAQNVLYRNTSLFWFYWHNSFICFVFGKFCCWWCCSSVVYIYICFAVFANRWNGCDIFHENRNKARTAGKEKKNRTNCWLAEYKYIKRIWNRSAGMCYEPDTLESVLNRYRA